MKKIVLLFFILSIMSFGSPRYNFKFEKVDLLNVKVSRKYNGWRNFEGTLKNKTDQEILAVKFKIKYRDKDVMKNDSYHTVGSIELYNLDPKEVINFKAYAKVFDMNNK
ncbi:MAG: hypothetical protein B6I28_00310 [Fusobacteriia bacterium 4572_132]|nr:MAG: hypothetical protein B6I28_00310 [Fusobacteriia bacterium 4572_132]